MPASSGSYLKNATVKLKPVSTHFPDEGPATSMNISKWQGPRISQTLPGTRKPENKLASAELAGFFARRCTKNLPRDTRNQRCHLPSRIQPRHLQSGK